MRVLLAFLLVMVSFGAVAHKAMSGWTYPAACCRGSEMGGDCKMIEAEDVTQNPDGSYTIKASGEVFLPPDKVSDPAHPDGVFEWQGARALRKGGHAKISPDGQWHRCFHTLSDPTDGTYCLWIVPPGT